MTNRAVENSFLRVGTPQMFGAVGDGVADDTAAVNAAIAAYDRVVFPKGSYKCGQLNTSNKSIKISGEGIGVTTLIQTASRLFNVAQNSSDYHVELGDFLINVDSSVVGAEPIYYDGSGQIVTGTIQNRLSPRLLISAVEIASDDNLSAGITLNNCMHATINDIHIHQDDGILTGDGIKIFGAGKPVEITITRSWCFNVNNAVSSVDTEGVLISSCNFVAINKGVLVVNATNKPHIAVQQSHINAIISNIDLTKVDNPVVSDNLLYRRPAAATGLDAVKLTDCANGAVTGNTITNGSWNQVALRGTTSGTVITGNSFHSYANAIDADAGTSDNDAYGNLFKIGTKKVNDAGANKLTTLENKAISYDLTALTGSFAPIDITNLSGSLDFTVGSSSITANRNMRVNFASCVEISGATGLFLVEVRVNNLHVKSMPHLANSAAVAGDVFPLSGYVDLLSGDVVTIEARSDVSQNVVSSTNSYFEMTEV